MTRFVLAAVALLLGMLAGTATGADESSLRAGKGFIETPVYTAAEDAELLSLFDGLRVADVTDGMDAAGLPAVGLMDPAIHPLWKDAEAFTHRFIGVAVTARYVPTQRAQAGRLRRRWRATPAASWTATRPDADACTRSSASPPTPRWSSVARPR